MRRLVVLLALAALAACGSKNDANAPKASSFGQVLPGSANDAMLPYDTVTSEPPLAAPTYDTPEGIRSSGPAAGTSGALDEDAAPDAVAT